MYHFDGVVFKIVTLRCLNHYVVFVVSPSLVHTHDVSFDRNSILFCNLILCVIASLTSMIGLWWIPSWRVSLLCTVSTLDDRV